MSNVADVEMKNFRLINTTKLKVYPTIKASSKYNCPQAHLPEVMSCTPDDHCGMSLSFTITFFTGLLFRSIRPVR